MTSTPGGISNGGGLSPLQQHFCFQCDRIVVTGTTRRLRPTRSVLQYLGSIEPTLFCPQQERKRQTAPIVLDFSRHILGEDGCVALIRTFFEFDPHKKSPPAGSHFAAPPARLSSPPTGTGSATPAVTTPRSQVTTSIDVNHSTGSPHLSSGSPNSGTSHGGPMLLNANVLDLRHNGLGDAAMEYICAFLVSPRGALLEQVILRQNERLALNAGQMILRTLGVQGPVGDGGSGMSYLMAEQVQKRSASHSAAVQGSPSGAHRGGGGPGSPFGATSKGANNNNSSGGSAALLPLVSASLQLIDVEETNVPPHIIRRIAERLRER